MFGTRPRPFSRAWSVAAAFKPGASGPNEIGQSRSGAAIPTVVVSDQYYDTDKREGKGLEAAWPVEETDSIHIGCSAPDAADELTY